MVLPIAAYKNKQKEKKREPSATALANSSGSAKATVTWDAEEIQGYARRRSQISAAQTLQQIKSNNSTWEEMHSSIVKDFRDGKTPLDLRNLNDYGPKKHWVYHLFSAIIWTCISAAGIFWSIVIADPMNKDGIVCGGILFVLSVGAITLDALPDATYGWKSFQMMFETIGGFNGLRVYAICCFLTSLTAWIIISMEEDSVIERNTAVEVLIWLTFYLGVLSMILCVISGWELVSYYFATVSWLQGFMWISIVGAIVLMNARLLRPPPTDRNVLTWHKNHPTQVLIDGIMFVLGGCWLFFVVMTCLFVPLFAEASRWAADVGVEIGILIYCIFAIIITLNPIAPGTAIDVTGGFIFVILFMEGWGWDFFLSWGIGLIIIIIIHYASACAQWYLGKIESVQLWMNRTAPIFILAASDATLDDANFWKVGLVGYVFLDTLNGLNQGRINMEFWTQLLSEWSCVPAAIALSALGASIAVQGDEDYSWTAVAVPMLIIMSGLVTALGSVAGAAELGNCTDRKEYWHNLEKWAIVQHFLFHGYACTKTGWANDIFEIVSSRKDYAGEVAEDKLDRSNCLLARIYPLQIDFIAKRSKATTKKEVSMIMMEFSNSRQEAREKHYRKIRDKIDKKLEEFKSNGFIVETEPQGVRHDFWADAGMGEKQKPWKRYLQYFVVASLVISYWGGIFGFFYAVDTAEAVQKGVSILNDIAAIYWVALAWFAIVFNLYIYNYWLNQITSIWGTVKFVFSGCNIAGAGDVETRFRPKKYIIPERFEREALQEAARKYGKDFVLVDPIEHEKNEAFAPEKWKKKHTMEMTKQKLTSDP